MGAEKSKRELSGVPCLGVIPVALAIPKGVCGVGTSAESSHVGESNGKKCFNSSHFWFVVQKYIPRRLEDKDHMGET